MDDWTRRRLHGTDRRRLGFREESEEADRDEDDGDETKKMEGDVERILEALHRGVPGLGSGAEGVDQANSEKRNQEVDDSGRVEE